MKKGFSLIELIFSIVVIGVCLAAIPKFVNASLEGDEIGYKQENFYELKELYGLMRTQALYQDNFAYDDSKNSQLRHFRATCGEHGSFKGGYIITELTTTGQDIISRLIAEKNYQIKGNVLTSIASLVGKDLNTTLIRNVFNEQTAYKFGKNSKVDKDNKVRLSLNAGFLSSNDEGLGATMTSGKYVCNNLIKKGALKVQKPDGETEVQFDVFFNTLGRLESIYSSYAMRTNSASFQADYESDLKAYIDLDK